jgi:hypothetical protein
MVLGTGKSKMLGVSIWLGPSCVIQSWKERKGERERKRERERERIVSKALL